MNLFSWRGIFTQTKMQNNDDIDNSMYGILCDIDGVLIKDGRPIPGAKEAIESWQMNPRAHLLLLTNSSGIKEEHKAQKTNEQLGIDKKCFIRSHQVIVAQTPMKSLAPRLANRNVLFVARDEENMEDLLRSDYGFKNLVRFSTFADDHAYLLPYTHQKHANFFASQNTENDPPIHAVFVLDYPRCFDDVLQVLVDLLMSDGRVGFLSDKQVVELYFANPDFLYAGNYKLPRFTQGAFRECLCHLFEKMTGRKLILTEFGKPYKSTYDYAKNYLNRFGDQTDQNITKYKTIYAIGDNPESDIRGANESGDEFFSILVRTGIFKGENSKEYPAKYVCDSIAEAFQFIEQRESSTNKVKL
jgi:HAD superfamily hydrolase (TIGR01456 family)